MQSKQRDKVFFSKREVNFVSLWHPNQKLFHHWRSVGSYTMPGHLTVYTGKEKNMATLKKGALILWVGFVSFSLLGGLSHACPVSCPDNNDCCFELRRIIQGGDITIDPPLITFGDNGAVWSYLYSFNPLSPGMYNIDFYFKNDLSDVAAPPPAPPFAFLDSFYATLLFRDDKTLPDCDDCYKSMPMFDLDAGGVFNNFGTVSTSPEGDDWLHFSMAFENMYAYVVPGFELIDWNCIDDDSQVQLANVCISQIPIPSAFLLLGSGLIGTIGLLRRRAKSNFHT